MPKQCVNDRARALAAFCACVLLVGASVKDALAAKPAISPFEAAFSASDEPAALYYRVTYEGRDGPHSLQVWRDGQSRLRRKTDDTLDTYIVRNPADPGEYQMTVVDYRKRITTRIDRNNLIRLGNFSDWFDLAHGLRHPSGAYELTASEAPAAAPTPISDCRWYALRQRDVTHRICWSVRDRLPLVIWQEQKGIVWRVTEVARKPIAADTFMLHDAGFVRNDANDDIDRD